MAAASMASLQRAQIALTKAFHCHPLHPCPRRGVQRMEALLRRALPDEDDAWAEERVDLNLLTILLDHLMNFEAILLRNEYQYQNPISKY